MIFYKKSLFVFILLLVLLLFIHIYIEIGKKPAEGTLKKYEKLDYFYNGKFYNKYRSINQYKDIENISKYKHKSNNGLLIKFIKSKFSIKKTQANKKIKPAFNEIPDDFSFYWLGHSNIIIELAKKKNNCRPCF